VKNWATWERDIQREGEEERGEGKREREENIDKRIQFKSFAAFVLFTMTIQSKQKT
jgi:hypothetical protein